MADKQALDVKTSHEDESKLQLQHMAAVLQGQSINCQKQKPVKPIAIVKPIMAMNNRVTSWSMGQNRRRMQELLSAGNEIRPLIHFDNDPYDSGDEGGILGLYREGQAQVAARRAFNRTIRQQWGSSSRQNSSNSNITTNFQTSSFLPHIDNEQLLATTAVRRQNQQIRFNQVDDVETSSLQTEPQPPVILVDMPVDFAEVVEDSNLMIASATMDDNQVNNNAIVVEQAMVHDELNVQSTFVSTVQEGMVSHQEGDEARMPSENVTHSQQELKDEGEVRAPPIRFFGRRLVKCWFQQQMNNTIRRDGWRYEFAFLLTPFSNHYVTATDCAQRTVACLVDALSTVNGRVRVWWLHVNWQFKRNRRRNAAHDDDFDTALFISSNNLDAICDLYRLIFGLDYLVYEGKKVKIALARASSRYSVSNLQSPEPLHPPPPSSAD